MLSGNNVSANNSIGDVPDGPSQPDVILDTEFYFRTFLTEVRDSMNEVYASSNRSDPPLLHKLIMEINSSKLANNVCQEDVAKGVFLSFLSMPIFGSESNIKKVFTESEKLFTDWDLIWKNYYRPEKSRIQLLVALEEAATENETILSLLPNLIMMVYNEMEDFSEKVVFDWYNGLPDDSNIKKRAKSAIETLEESDSDEETEDSGDE